MRTIPNMTVSAPMDELELRNLMYSAQLPDKGPFAIRYPRGNGMHADWKKEFTEIPVGKGRKLAEGKILTGVPKLSKIWMSHGDSVSRLPAGFINCAQTPDCNVAAMACVKKNIYGLQFHPGCPHNSNRC